MPVLGDGCQIAGFGFEHEVVVAALVRCTSVEAPVLLLCQHCEVRVPWTRDRRDKNVEWHAGAAILLLHDPC